MIRLHRFYVSLFLISALFIGGCATGNTSRGWNQPQTSREASQQPSNLNVPPARQQQVPSAQTRYQQSQPQVPPPVAGGFANLPPVKVAILLPLSGQQGAVGQSLLQAAQLALFDMGYEKFELIPKDTLGTPQGATIAATDAINEGAQLILGPLLSDSVKAAKSVAARHNINIIALSTDWELANNNTFIMGFMPFAQVQRVAQYAAAKGYKNVGIISANGQYGDAVTQVFNVQAGKNGLKVVDTLRIDPRDNNVTDKLPPFTGENLATPRFDAVFMPVGGAQINMLANGLSYYGLTPDKVRRLGTGLWDDPRIASEKNMDGAWFAAPSPRVRRTFEQKYQQTYGQQPLRVSSLGYDATALAAVLARTGYDRTGRPAFDRASLINPNGFAGVDGIFRFRPDGLVERGLAVLEIKSGRIVEIDPAPMTFQSMDY